MARFRKKPVVIEAVQLGWDNWSEMCEFAGVGMMSDGKPQGCFLDAANNPLPQEHSSHRMGLHIPTLEGVMLAVQGDWIIRGVKGELYPCKPDIFEATYESANTEPAPIDMLLWCPRCYEQHVDRPEPEARWANPPHKAHLCHGCGLIWRPADVPTNGVATLRTGAEASA